MTNGLSYKIGGAGQTKTGNDYSDGAKDSSMDVSMRDIEALADGFSQLSIASILIPLKARQSHRCFQAMKYSRH